MVSGRTVARAPARNVCRLRQLHRVQMIHNRIISRFADVFPRREIFSSPSPAEAPRVERPSFALTNARPRRNIVKSIMKLLPAAVLIPNRCGIAIAPTDRYKFRYSLHRAMPITIVEIDSRDHSKLFEAARASSYISYAYACRPPILARLLRDLFVRYYPCGNPSVPRAITVGYTRLHRWVTFARTVVLICISKRTER